MLEYIAGIVLAFHLFQAEKVFTPIGVRPIVQIRLRVIDIFAGGVSSRMGDGTLNVRGDVFGIGSGEFTAIGGTVSYHRPF